MKRIRRSRKQQKLDNKQHHDMMARTKTDDAAAKAFRHKAFTVDEYIASKGIDTKGEIADG